ncbi:hypothetical protein P7C70_g7518, partial [Phenoliferia sp. Uapishka_3]
MKDAFSDKDKHKYSLTSLQKFVAKLKQQGKPDKLSKVSQIYLKFTEILTYLKDRQIIGVPEESRYFVSILPEEIVGMIHSRRDTRRLVKNGGNNVDDDECTLPPITEIIKEVRSIYADFAWRELSYDSDELASSDQDDIFCKPKKSPSHSTHTNSRQGKSSKTSNSDRGYEKTRSPTPTKRKEEPQPKEDPMKDLLLKLSELQVNVAQLANQAQASGSSGNQGPLYMKRNSFSQGTRPPVQPQTQNPNAGRWNAPRWDAPPHESNTAAYESTYYSNYAGTGTTTVPIGQGAQTQWGNRAHVGSVMMGMTFKGCRITWMRVKQMALACPQPDYPPSAPRKERECGSMMFPVKTLQRYKSIDMAKFTHGHRNIGKSIEVVGSTTGATSELLPFEMDDWIHEEKARIKEDEDAGDLKNAYQQLCAKDDKMKVSQSNWETPSQIKDEEAVIAELGLHPSPSITPGKQTTEDLISELAMCIKGCVFTTNLVELLNPEESFPMEEDWPTPGEENDSDASGFEVDDDDYYSMMKGASNVHLDSGNKDSRTCGNQEESAAAYGKPADRCADTSKEDGDTSSRI